MSHGPFPRLGFSFVLLLLTLHSMSTGAGPPAGRGDPAATKAGLSSLPIQAQASISAALGRDQRAYHAKRDSRAWRIENPKHGLRADFTSRGVEYKGVQCVSDCDSPGSAAGRGSKPSPRPSPRQSRTASTTRVIG